MHKFDPALAGKLESEERMKIQPVDPLLKLLHLKGKEVIVDLGAGTGYFSFPIARSCPSCKVYCLDLQEGMLAILREKKERLELPGVEILRSGETEIPLPDAFADTVLMANVFHELHNPGRTAKEVWRILKEGGRVLVIDWKPVPTEFGPPLEERKDVQEVLLTLVRAGFKKLEEVALYPYHYTVVGNKEEG